MKKIKNLILCLATAMLLSSCGFKNADTAKDSMHNVNTSASALKDETESSQQCTEDLKKKETNESVETHQW